MHKVLHPRDDIAWIFVSKKGGRGHSSIEDSVRPSIQWLEDFREKHRGRVIATRNNTDDRRINNKQHLQRENLNVAKKENLKRETEFLQTAAQTNAIRTNYIKARMYKSQQNYICGLWGVGDEKINQIISECNKLAHKEYKTRGDGLCKVIQWFNGNYTGNPLGFWDKNA